VGESWLRGSLRGRPGGHSGRFLEACSQALDVPVLVTSGRHDEMTETLVKPLVAGIRGAEWGLFDNSAHFAPVEEPDRYLSLPLSLAE
jgi:pimeloyl-ACP methyl ester carboxylesterase